jgi:hypothetical protein
LKRSYNLYEILYPRIAFVDHYGHPVFKDSLYYFIHGTDVVYTTIASGPFFVGRLDGTFKNSKDVKKYLRKLKKLKNESKTNST